MSNLKQGICGNNGILECWKDGGRRRQESGDRRQEKRKRLEGWNGGRMEVGFVRTTPGQRRQPPSLTVKVSGLDM
jgi:hypothetical protein